MFQVQHYIRSGRWIGIATLTTLESELLKVRGDFDQFMKLLRLARSWDDASGESCQLELLAGRDHPMASL